MEWKVIEKDGLPPEGEEVFFDGGENPPVFGTIKYNGKHPSILVYDSSGEEDYLSVEDYERWLDESQPYLTIQQEQSEPEYYNDDSDDFDEIEEWDDEDNLPF